MRFSTSYILLASVAALAVAAPVTEKRQDVAQILQLQQLQQFQSFSANDILALLQQSQSFNINNFNSQFNSGFDVVAIQTLLIQLQSNSFGNSNLFDFAQNNDFNSFNINAFSNSFNSAFNTNWNSNEIAQLLLELQLIDGSQFNNLNAFSLLANNGLSNDQLNSFMQALSVTIG